MAKDKIDVLNGLNKELNKGATVKIGILGSSEKRDKKGNDSSSNLEIGTTHEFGAVKKDGTIIPQRSFLRLTYAKNTEAFRSYLKKNEKQFKELIAKQGMEAALAEIGRWWVEAVLNTFSAQGYGTWDDLAPRTVAKKGSTEILTETGALKRAITFEVAQ